MVQGVDCGWRWGRSPGVGESVGGVESGLRWRREGSWGWEGIDGVESDRMRGKSPGLGMEVERASRGFC